MKFNGKKIADYTYVFQCIKCTKDVVCRNAYDVNKHSGLCTSCCQKKAPYKHMYMRLRATARNDEKDVSITFEDYLTFIHKDCHYCSDKIPWLEHSSYSQSKRSSSAYYVDRKDSSQGYHPDNVVPCCTRCNRGKSAFFSYEEWYGMCEYLRNKNVVDKL